MNFEYELTSELRQAKAGEDVDFRVEGFISSDSFYLTKAEVYAPALDMYFDCLDSFKNMSSYMEKINEMAAEDLADAKFSQEFENWID